MGSSRGAYLCYKVSTRVNDDNPVVPSVCYDNVSHVINSNALGTRELGVPVAVTTEDVSCGTVWINH